MDSSFELLTSMSPKINKYQKPIQRAPTRLALKKYFRKSVELSKANKSITNDSIISVESSTCSSNKSTESKNSNYLSPIVISDSDTSFNDKKTPIKKPLELFNNKNTSVRRDISERLSKEKYSNIKNWVDEVNKAKTNVSIFSEVSGIDEDDNSCFKKPGTNVAANSTSLELVVKRFDELFKNSSEKKCNLSFQKSNDDKNNFDDSLISDSFEKKNENISIDDYLRSNEEEGLSSRLQKKKLTENVESRTSPENSIKIGLHDSGEYENLLDSIYGTSWREKKEDILPSSEPHVKKAVSKKNILISERRLNKVSTFTHSPVVPNGKNDSNLLKILQKAKFKKALESPWVESLKNICDSDSESDISEKSLPRIKLDFGNDENVCSNTEPLTSESRSPLNSIQVKSKSRAIKSKTKKQENPAKQVTKTYSFLASLSANVPLEKSDVSALIFRNDFKSHKETLTAKLFNLFNEKVFENALPKNTPIEWRDRLIRTAGSCTCKKITRRTGAIERVVKLNLSSKVLDSADRLRDTLIHELCHAATWIVNKVSDGHGSFWKSWANRAMNAFPELPPIRRCHNYVINTKYTYKCTGCGYSVGRHSKSLDVERKRCGYCYGTFEVLINKTSKNGETKSVPATPKKVGGFALFVKENYANFKTPDLKHGDVMKILGQQFSNLKVDK